MQDWQSRAIIEFVELTNRIDACRKMLKDWEAGTLNYTPSNPKRLSESQLEAMERYRDILWERLAYVVGVKKVEGENCPQPTQQ